MSFVYRADASNLIGVSNDVERRLNGLEKAAGGFGTVLKGALLGVGFAVVQKGLELVGGALGGAERAVIGMNAQLEQSKVSWGVLLGSSEAAEQQLATLYDFAAKTPFAFPEVEKASRLLETFGGATLNTKDNLTLIGDVASGVGQPFEDVAMWTARMYDAFKNGQPFGEASARLQEMGAMSGDTRLKLEQMQKAGASQEELWAALSGSFGRFGGMMEQQSATFNGRMSTMKDSLTQLAATAGKPIFDMLSNGLGILLDPDHLGSPAVLAFATAFAVDLANGAAQGGKALLGFGRDVVAILGPVKDAAGGLLSAFQSGDFNAAFGPLLTALDAAFGPGTSDKVALFVSQLLRGFQLVRDGFITVQQALSGKWVGDDTVQPAVRAVGDFAVRLRDFALTAKDVFFNQVLPAVQQVAGFIRDHMDTIARVVAIGAAAFAAFSIIATVVGWVTSAIAIWGVLSVAIEGVGGIVAALVVVLGGPLTLAIAAIVGIVALLAIAWSNNWGDIQGKVAAVWAWLQPVLADLGARLSQFWTDILPQLRAAWESVSTKVVAATQWLWGVLQVVFGAVAGFLSAHGDQILAVLGGAWALIRDTINTYLGVISNLVRGVLALISGDWDGAWAYIRRAATIAWDGLVSFFGAAGGLLVQALGAIWGLIQRAAAAAWDAISAAVGGKFSDLGAAIRGKLDDIGGWWRDRWTAVSSFVSGIWDGIVSGVTGALLSLYNTVTGKVADLRSWLNDRWNDIKQTALDLWNSMVGQIVQAVIGLGVTILREIGQTQALLLAIFVRIAQNGLDKFTDLYNWVTGKARDLYDAVTGKLGDLRDEAGRIWGSAYQQAAGLWATLWKTVTQTATDLRDDLDRLITTARDSLGQRWDDIYKKATSAWSGVRDFAAQIAADMQAKITGPIDAAKGLLDTAWGAIYTKAIDAWNGVRQHLFNTGQDLLDRVTSPITSGKALLDTAWGDINTKAKGAWDDIKLHLTNGAQTMKDAMLSPFTSARDAIEGIVNGFGNGIIRSLNGAGDRVRGFGNGVRSIINWIAEKLGAQGISGDSPAFSLPGLATGTQNWGGGMAWVGEGPGGAGAELAYLPRGAQVLTHAESMALVRSGAVAPPQSGPAKLPGFVGGLGDLGGIVEVLKKGAGWLYDQAKSAVGLGDLSLPGSLGDIGGKLAGKVKDWALGSIDKMLKAATPVPSVSGDQIQRGIGFAEAQMGKPYVWGGGHGGDQPINAAGWDCSGFVSAVLNAMGIPHPRYGIVTSFFEWMEQGPKTGYVDIGVNNPYAAPDVQHMGMALGGTQYESGGPFGGVGKNGTNFQYWGHPPGLTAPPAPSTTTGQGGQFRGNGSGVVDAILSKIGNDSYTGLALLEGSHMEGGWGPTFGVGDPDQGGSFGPFQINWNAHKIPRAQAEDPAFAVDYMYPGYFRATRDKSLPWGSDPGWAAARAAYVAERPYEMYPNDRIRAAYADSGPIVGMADGGVITEPIVGRGQRSGRSYTFGEAGPEAIFNADQLAALSPRGTGGGDTHISNYTIVSSTPEITVDQLKREQRREERLRGYGR